ncbi:nucleotidyltransferase domain-containing protein [Micromonospora sp. WMMD1102]|uniref:nucleotidyltransferase domain-containing protein n=1 Tax=Micromonospora sp. WMMD1102 TaxID=3016105 RepID=UPI002414DC86|nr:nucleotidyltransferase domain-containing protein [Micromonospora sp. WMMD1102]MDG4786307.1 nucleotidyltransferase domain-containing protein [Micromonospora sp. WMMD1102]
MPRRATAPRLPDGTQVVLRHTAADLAGVRVQRGATGRVVDHDPVEDDYLIQLTDGRRLRSPRGQLALRKAYQRNLAVRAAAVDGPGLVARHTIYAAVVGSRAFGLATEESDTDVRGVYAAPTAAFWSLAKPPSHVEGPEPERFSWEVERFCELALKANPNLLEVLHSPAVLVVTPLGEELRELRDAFLSQLVYQTYSGYVLSQFKKLEADLRQHGEPRWKHVMHLLRLLTAAGDLLRYGRLELDVGPHRDRLLAVRRGEVPWAEVERWRLALHADLDEAVTHTPLPAAPDAARVDAWLHSVRARGAREEPT